MFKKIKKTTNTPNSPELVWDGDCGFCKYWKTRWQLKTDDKIRYVTFQEVHQFYEDIPLKEFKKASRLIETDGKIYSGPDSAYRALWHSGNYFWHHLYQKQSWFRYISDHSYNHIAKHRALYYKVTTFLLGKDPHKLSYKKPLFIVVSLFLVLMLLYVFN